MKKSRYATFTLKWILWSWKCISSISVFQYTVDSDVISTWAVPTVRLRTLQLRWDALGNSNLLDSIDEMRTDSLLQSDRHRALLLVAQNNRKLTFPYSSSYRDIDSETLLLLFNYLCCLYFRIKVSHFANHRTHSMKGKAKYENNTKFIENISFRGSDILFIFQCAVLLSLSKLTERYSIPSPSYFEVHTWWKPILSFHFHNIFIINWKAVYLLCQRSSFPPCLSIPLAPQNNSSF